MLHCDYSRHGRRRSALVTAFALLAALLYSGLFGAGAAQASQGGCTTAWSEGFNIGSCISDRNTGTTGFPDAYVNYVPSPSTCDIHIQVWDDNNHQYSDKQVACTAGHYTGNSAAPSSAATVHGYARLDLNGTHFAAGNSPSIRLRQGVSGQGGCTTYTTQGFSIGVCVNDQHTGTTAYPDIYVNSTPFPTTCSLEVQSWDDHNHQLSGGSQMPCSTGHITGNPTGDLTATTNAHAYVRINLNGGAYPGPDSPSISLTGGAVYHYVNLGDSLSSGEGTQNYTNETNSVGNQCHRSDSSYSGQYTNISTHYHMVDNVACSGAVIKEFYHAVTPVNSMNVPDAGELDQDLALGSGTTLVTVSLGINDVDFADLLIGCYGTGLTKAISDIDACFIDKLTNADYNGGTETFSQLIDDQGGSLTSLYKDIKKDAPNARVVAVTYPQIYPATGDVDTNAHDCANGLRGGEIITSQKQLDLLRAALVHLDNVIVTAANNAGIDHLDERDAFKGHELCTTDPWENTIVGLGGNDSFHPNTAGYAKYAADLKAHLGS